LSYGVVSLDLCGTIADCRGYDDLWYRIIPGLYSRSRGTSFDESVKKLRERYSLVGPSSIEWYKPSHWISELSLDMAEYKKAASGINVKVAEGLVKRLKEKYRVILTTNVAKEVLELTVNLKLFDAVYSCVDMGTPKKDERFWKMLIAGEREMPYRILHLGDDYVYDYLIPSMAGIRACTTSFNKVGYDLQRELFIRP
jgi:FMN phosphatase YigB (HAD superfamily)